MGERGEQYRTSGDVAVAHAANSDICGRMSHLPDGQAQIPITTDIVAGQTSQIPGMDHHAVLVDILTRIAQFEFPGPFGPFVSGIPERRSNISIAPWTLH